MKIGRGITIAWVIAIFGMHNRKEGIRQIFEFQIAHLMGGNFFRVDFLALMIANFLVEYRFSC
jgi:hypothetical protein